MTLHLKPLFSLASKTAVVCFALSLFSVFLSSFFLIGILAAPITLGIGLLGCILAPDFFHDPFESKTPTPHKSSAQLAVASYFFICLALTGFLAHITDNPWGQMGIFVSGGALSLTVMATQLRSDPDWIISVGVVCMCVVIGLIFFILIDYIMEQSFSNMMAPAWKTGSVWLFLTAVFGTAFFLGNSLLHGGSHQITSTLTYIACMAIPGAFAPDHMPTFLTLTTGLGLLAAVSHALWEDEYFGKIFVQRIHSTSQEEYEQALAMAQISLLKAFRENDLDPHQGAFSLSHHTPSRWYESPRWSLSWSLSFQHRDFYKVTSTIAHLLSQTFQTNVNTKHSEKEFSLPGTRHGQMALHKQATKRQIELAMDLTFHDN